MRASVTLAAVQTAGDVHSIGSRAIDASSSHRRSMWRRHRAGRFLAMAPSTCRVLDASEFCVCHHGWKSSGWQPCGTIAAANAPKESGHLLGDAADYLRDTLGSELVAALARALLDARPSYHRGPRPRIEAAAAIVARVGGLSGEPGQGISAGGQPAFLS